jgi:hypothetical protein
MGILEQEREIAGAGIAEHGQDAQVRALGEEASHVGRENGFRGGRRTSYQAKPSVRGLPLSRNTFARSRAFARRETDQNETNKR